MLKLIGHNKPLYLHLLNLQSSCPKRKRLVAFEIHHCHDQWIHQTGKNMNPRCWMMPLGTQRMINAVFMIICFFLLVLISERCLLHSLCRYGMGDGPPIPSWFGCPANMNVTIVNYILASGFSLAPVLVALVWSVGKLAPRTKWRDWLKIYLSCCIGIDGHCCAVKEICL